MDWLWVVVILGPPLSYLIGYLMGLYISSLK